MSDSKKSGAPGGPIRVVPYTPFDPGTAAAAAAQAFYEIMRRRRSVRKFSDKPVGREVIEWCVRAAGTAPSGANKQPWRFVAVSDPALKNEIRAGAEAEEKEFYERRATPEWLADLAPLGTDANKDFLETAPWLVVLFKLARDDPDESGKQGQVYYINESVGIAAGLFISAVHHAGLVTLTHTPSPMGFLGKILKRPEHERPFLLLPVGYPAEGCVVPDIQKKEIGEILVFE